MLTVETIDNTKPFVRMMRLKKSAGLSGKWRDLDNVFTYVASGEAEFIIGGVSYYLHAGEAILIPPYQTHIIFSKGQDMLVQYIFHFDFYTDPERKKLINKDILSQNVRPDSILECEKLLDDHVAIASFDEIQRNKIMRIYMLMRNEFQHQQMGTENILSDFTKIMLTEMIRSIKAEHAMNGIKVNNSKSWAHVESAINYIHDNELSSKLDNETIANAIGVTPNYLTGIFKQCIGLSLHRYIMLLRMGKAQKILLSGKHNITEAASEVGFSSVYIFSKEFKKQYGISPTGFINQSVNKEDIDSVTDNNISYYQ